MWETLEVVLIYSFILGSIYLLISLGFSIICWVLRIFHLGYAYLFTLTVYLTWMFMKEFGFGLIPSLLGMVAVQFLISFLSKSSKRTLELPSQVTLSIHPQSSLTLNEGGRRGECVAARRGLRHIYPANGALSKRGKVRPFAADSDGTLLGEGLGIVVLKRLSDALADGDRIYAVVRGTGEASDGRGLGLLVPSVEGEALAIERAYSASGVHPSTVGLVEAHGTGIPLGDKTEIAALRKIFGERRGAQGHIALGSVKSIIGHCIPAAGIAGLIKSALALHHKVLPPTLCENISPELGIEATPLYVNTAARSWISPAQPPGLVAARAGERRGEGQRARVGPPHHRQLNQLEWIEETNEPITFATVRLLTSGLDCEPVELVRVSGV